MKKEKAINFQPLRDRLLVKQDEADEAARPGSVIIKADISKEAPQRGMVVAVGEGKTMPAYSGGLVTIPLALKVGDKVYFAKFTGKAVFLDRGDGVSEYFLVMKEDDVLGIERKAQS